MIVFAVFCFLIILALLINLVMPEFLNDINVGFYLIIISLFALSIVIICLRKRHSFFRTLSIYLCGFLTLFIITEAALIYYSSNQDPTGKEELIIVTGSGLFVESRLTFELEERLDTAINLYQNNQNLQIILSGGTDENRALPECVAMKSYLEKNITELGLKPPTIITEDKSSGLYQNIENSFKLSDVSSAYVIVSRHNVARTKIILNRLSPSSTVIGADYPISKYIIYYIREFGYAVKTFLLDGVI